MTGGLREALEDLAATYDRKAAHLRRLVPGRQDAEDISRLTGKAGTYEAEARELRALLAIHADPSTISMTEALNFVYHAARMVAAGTPQKAAERLVLAWNTRDTVIGELHDGGGG